MSLGRRVNLFKPSDDSFCESARERDDFNSEIAKKSFSIQRYFLLLLRVLTEGYSRSLPSIIWLKDASMLDSYFLSNIRLYIKLRLVEEWFYCWQCHMGKTFYHPTSLELGKEAVIVTLRNNLGYWPLNFLFYFFIFLWRFIYGSWCVCFDCPMRFFKRLLLQGTPKLLDKHL